MTQNGCNPLKLEASSLRFYKLTVTPLTRVQTEKMRNVKLGTKCRVIKQTHVPLDFLISFALLQNDKAEKRNHKNKT